jgi:hypothetical protein
MYCLWKTQGVSAHPWRDDLVLGCVQKGKTLYLCMTADQAWDGQLVFDTARHKTVMHLPIDWPRINQFPEWFTVQSDVSYAVHSMANGQHQTHKGKDLHQGFDLSIKGGAQIQLRIEPEAMSKK